MKKFFCTILTILLLSSASLWADRAGYTIKNYNFEGVYHSNNTISVKETIDVNFDESRHGIYRTIPGYFYLDVSSDPDVSDLKKYSTYVEDFSAGGEPFSDDDDNLYTFRLGDKDIEITGPKHYELTYTYVIPDDRTEECDFIYYSVLGAEWAATIDHFSFSMSFDNGVPENYEVYSGEYGDRNNSCTIETKVVGNSICGSADNIQPNNAITLFATVPEGYFTGEKKSVPAPLAWILYVIAMGIGIFAIYKIVKTQVKKPVQTVELYPPENINSAEVGTIIDNSADTEDLISLIPYFASKGYLSVSEEKVKSKTKTTLLKVKDIPDAAPEYQKIFFNSLFKEKNELELDKLPEDFANDIKDAQHELQNVFKGKRNLYDGKTKAFSLPMLVYLFTLAAIVFDDPAEWLGNLGFFFIPEIFLGMSHFISMMSYKRNFHKKSFVLWIILDAIVTAFAGLIYLSGIVTGLAESILPWWCSALLFIVDFIVGAFSYRLITPTDWNIEVTGKLLGLKEFIRTAELPKLKMLSDSNPEYFYDILPYAMVFGLSDKWANSFKNIDVQKPAWYRSTTYDVFRADMFVHSINNGIYSSISESVSKANASSGGGGFSGGGGGGGGGGSW